MFRVFWVLSEKSLLTLGYRNALPCFLLDVLFTLWFMTHLRFLCVAWGKRKGTFSPPHFYPVGLALFLWKPFPPPWNVLGTFVENQWPVSVFLLMSVSGLFILLHWHICLSLSQYHCLDNSGFTVSIVWIPPLCSFSRLSDNSRAFAFPYKILESNCQILKKSPWSALQNPAMPRLYAMAVKSESFRGWIQVIIC